MSSMIPTVVLLLNRYVADGLLSAMMGMGLG